MSSRQFLITGADPGFFKGGSTLKLYYYYYTDRFRSTYINHDQRQLSTREPDLLYIPPKNKLNRENEGVRSNHATPDPPLYCIIYSRLTRSRRCQFHGLSLCQKVFTTVLLKPRSSLIQAVVQASCKSCPTARIAQTPL